MILKRLKMIKKNFLKNDVINFEIFFKKEFKEPFLILQKKLVNGKASEVMKTSKGVLDMQKSVEKMVNEYEKEGFTVESDIDYEENIKILVDYYISNEDKNAVIDKAMKEGKIPNFVKTELLKNADSSSEPPIEISKFSDYLAQESLSYLTKAGFKLGSEAKGVVLFKRGEGEKEITEIVLKVVFTKKQNSKPNDSFDGNNRRF